MKTKMIPVLMAAVTMTSAIPTLANAQGVRVESFSIVQGASNPIEILVDRYADDLPRARVVSCAGKTLSAEEAEETAFLLNRDEESASLAILDNRAVLASQVKVENPQNASGYFPPSLVVNFSFEGISYSDGFRSVGGYNYAKVIRPLVVVDGKISDVVGKIMAQALNTSAKICRKQ
jgi:hypothetical protein